MGQVAGTETCGRTVERQTEVLPRFANVAPTKRNGPIVSISPAILGRWLHVANNRKPSTQQRSDGDPMVKIR